MPRAETCSSANYFPAPSGRCSVVVHDKAHNTENNKSYVAQQNQAAQDDAGDGVTGALGRRVLTDIVQTQDTEDQRRRSQGQAHARNQGEHTEIIGKERLGLV